MSLTPRPWYREVALLIGARLNCENAQWHSRHTTSLEALQDMLPSGAGIDSGCSIDLDKSTPEKLVITTGYHHMDDYGYYNGWTDHVVTVKPSLQFGITIAISGRDRNDIKEYLNDVLHQAVEEMVWQTEDCKWHSTPWDTLPDKQKVNVALAVLNEEVW